MTARTSPAPPRRPPVPLRVATVSAVLLAVLLAVLVPAGPALAHTRLAASLPAPGTEVPPDLAEVVLSFTGEVRGELSAVALTRPDGTAAGAGPLTVRGRDVVQPVRSPLGAGAWTVAYRVLARDGHPVTGTVEFSVAEPAPGAGGPPSDAPSTDVPQPPGAPAPVTDVELAAGSEEEGGSVLVPALAVTALAVALGALALRRRAARSGSG